MKMTLRLLGTGSVHAAPLYGCHCVACTRALNQPQYRREPCSAVLEVNGMQLLIDANHPQLQSRFPAGSIHAILLTHYHMDHVQALFDLRWGVGATIPVYQPADPLGCDDLYKYPGLLDFQAPNQAGSRFALADIEITPLALNHSRPCHGYVFTTEQGSIAYLTDTKGIPEASWRHLRAVQPRYIVIDCSYSPLQQADNHNSLVDVLDLAAQLPNSQWFLTHVGHLLDDYLITHPDALRPNVTLAYDDDCFTV